MSLPLPVLPPSTGGIPSIRLDPRTYARALSCVHCGLCLPACPTYNQTAHEADSPRGRIQLMRGLAEGTVSPTESVVRHLDLCLDCRACETACPSGVVYHELIEETRARLAETAPEPSRQDAVLRWFFLNILTRPTRLKAALAPARVLQKLGLYDLLRRSGAMRLLPGGFAKLEQMLPDSGPLWPAKLPTITPARGKRKMRVAMLEGCVGSVMFADTTRKAIELMAACGAEVWVPPRQSCCGAVHHHNAAEDEAREMAIANLRAFKGAADPPDYIVSAVAGCGAMLREYDHLLRDTRHAAAARAFSAKVRDVTQVIAELGLPAGLKPVAMRATYHDACHLAHAQRVTVEPRALLAQVPGLSMAPLPESDLCCGAAGTYNLTQPVMATSLADRKLANIDATDAEVCITGNAGCALHIAGRARATGRPIRVLHPVDILHSAVFGDPRRERTTERTTEADVKPS